MSQQLIGTGLVKGMKPTRAIALSQISQTKVRDNFDPFGMPMNIIRRITKANVMLIVIANEKSAFPTSAEIARK